MIPMRRSKQQLSPETCDQILERNTSGVLALNSKQGPYAVPLSYVYANGQIIFHGAISGHKMNAIAHDARASFCVIDADDVLPEEFTTRYRSVIVTGNVKILEEQNDKIEALSALGMSCYPNKDACSEEISKFIDSTCVFVLEPSSITGKRGLKATEE